MHELAICQSLIQQVESIAQQHGARGADYIRLEIGPLAGVEAPLLERAFTIARAGTLAETATLDIVIQPLQVRCNTCGGESEAKSNRLLCGHCGDWHIEIVSGDQMLLTRVELTLEEDDHV